MAQDTMAMLCSTLQSTTGAFASEITGGGRREGPEDTGLSKLSHSKCRFLLKWPGKSESTLPEHSENAHRKPWGCCYWERRRKRVMEGSLPPLHRKRFVVPCSTLETVQMDKGMEGSWVVISGTRQEAVFCDEATGQDTCFLGIQRGASIDLVSQPLTPIMSWWTCQWKCVSSMGTGESVHCITNIGRFGEKGKNQHNKMQKTKGNL